jgi:hypothetical protein
VLVVTLTGEAVPSGCSASVLVGSRAIWVGWVALPRPDGLKPPADNFVLVRMVVGTHGSGLDAPIATQVSSMVSFLDRKSLESWRLRSVAAPIRS